MLSASLSVAAMAQEKYELGKPNNDNYRYLDEYQALKNYIDYSKYPNFKLGIGTTVNEYLNNSLVRNMTNKNFTETVAGNAMRGWQWKHELHHGEKLCEHRNQGRTERVWSHPCLALSATQRMVEKAACPQACTRTHRRRCGRVDGDIRQGLPFKPKCRLESIRIRICLLAHL